MGSVGEVRLGRCMFRPLFVHNILGWVDRLGFCHLLSFFGGDYLVQILVGASVGTMVFRKLKIHVLKI